MEVTFTGSGTIHASGNLYALLRPVFSIEITLKSGQKLVFKDLVVNNE